MKFKETISKAADKYISGFNDVNTFNKTLVWEAFINGAMWAYENPHIENTVITEEYLLNNHFEKIDENKYETKIRYIVNNEVYGTIKIVDYLHFWECTLSTPDVHICKKITTVDEFVKTLKLCLNNVEDYYLKNILDK